MNNFRKLRPFPWFCLNNFPFIEQTFDEINYWNLLGRVVGKLNEVIDSTNKMGGQVEDLTILVNQLKDYMEHYFDNLDVQEEINNKLDEMAEDGTLASIVETFINASCIKYYSNVEEMKSATNLYEGNIAETKGFYSENDNGNAQYIIREKVENETADNISTFEINDITLIAEIINPNNLLQLGIVNDGLTDNGNKLSTILNKYTNINGCGGIVIISEQILLNNENNKYNFDFKNTTIKVLDSIESDLDYVIRIKANGSLNRVVGEIKNLNIDGSGKAEKCLYIQDTSQLALNNILLTSATVCEYHIDNTSNRRGSTIIVNNMRCVNGYEYDLVACKNSKALLIEAPDSHYSNIVTMGYSIHIDVKNYNVFSKIHSWNYKTDTINNSIMFKVGGQGIFSDCYSDTLQTMFDIDGTGSLDISNPQFFLNTDFYADTHNKPTPFVVSNDFINGFGRIRVSNGRFQARSGFTDLKLINYDVSSTLRLSLLNIVNTYTGSYNFPDNFKNFSNKTLDIDTAGVTGVSSITYSNKQIVNINGLNKIILNATVGEVLTRGDYISIGTITNPNFVVQNNLTKVGFIRNNTNSFTHPILCRIKTDYSIEINIPYNLELSTTSNALIIELDNVLNTSNNNFN